MNAMDHLPEKYTVCLLSVKYNGHSEIHPQAKVQEEVVEPRLEIVSCL